MGLRVDVFPGMFVYCERKVEDTRGKVAPYGWTATMTRNNCDKIFWGKVRLMVTFGYFLLLRCDVLRSVVFDGGESMLCIHINRNDLQVSLITLKNMMNLINFPQDSTCCMNGCNIRETFEANNKEEHILNTPLFPRVPENLQWNMYLQKLPVVAQPKKRIRHSRIPGRQ